MPRWASMFVHKAHSITVNHVDQKVATIQNEFSCNESLHSSFSLVAICNALSINQYSPSNSFDALGNKE
ncbi:hypothetical protein SE23_11265 [Vibrio sinaloensis]|nr:hypothetical protein SE23_11265 [Vibrio sinaloensis]